MSEHHSMQQLGFFGADSFAPELPKKNTKPHECLELLLAGKRLTQEKTLWLGWRLAAYIYALKQLGWQIERREITTPSGKTSIAEYWLTKEIIAQFSPLLHKERT